MLRDCENTTMPANARIAAFTLLCAAALAPAAQAASPNHQYRLDGNLADDLAGPDLVSAGGALDATGYSFGANQGLTMGVDLGTTYTIDLLFHFDTVNAGWNKIVDYKSLNLDSGMYTLNGSWNYCCGNSSFGAVVAGVDARLTLTRNGAGVVAIYVNGALNASFGNDSGIGDFTGNFARFFIDDFATSQGEARAGRVDFIRTFDSMLSATEVADLGNVPSPIPEPASVALMVLGLAGMAGVSSATRRR
jgi:hypothetical protein